MISDLPRESINVTAFHCAVVPNHQQILRDAGVDSDGFSEILTELGHILPPHSAESVFYKPFEKSSGIKFLQTRFSDGTWPVRYTALTARTARREFLYSRLARGQVPDITSAKVQFTEIECSFSGEIKDLWPKLAEWPFLTAKDGYDRCNEIARAAIRERLDGLTTPSAQDMGGTCLPIFFRAAGRQPRYVARREYSYEPKRAVWVETDNSI